MIIDFHTHVFPDEIAGKTVARLENYAHIKAYADGTLSGLKHSMKENGITYSVVLPVVTKPSQFDTVNHYARSINGKDGIISFGGIHPGSEDYKEQLKAIKEMGFMGIKLHPDYQDTFVDDPKMVRLIQYASDLGLTVVLHSGMDIGLPEPVHCSAVRAANMLDRIHSRSANIVLAHAGAYNDWDNVENYIAGRNVWIDTAYSLGWMEDEQFIRIVKKHGANRILFASDSPWDSQGGTYEYLKKFNLSDSELNQILYQNAKGLLHME